MRLLQILSTLAIFFLTISGHKHFSEDHHWINWKNTYGKTYKNEELEAHKYNQFVQNKHYISQRQSQVNHRLSLNAFADIGREEWSNRFTKSTKQINDQWNLMSTPSNMSLEIDWRDANKNPEHIVAVNPVKNQGQCGSCWAFSTIASVETRWAIAKKHLVSLSEQELVDCSTSFGNNGCQGGLMDNAMKFIIANGGVCSEESYPYVGSNPYHKKWLSTYGSLKACCGCDCQCGDCPQPCADCPVGVLAATEATVDMYKITNPFHHNWISMYGSLKGCCGCDCQCGDCPEPCADCPVGVLASVSDDTCHSANCKSVVTISSYNDVQPMNETQLLFATMAGTVSIAIEADSQDFQFYSGGVFSSPNCGTNLDHGVAIVGFGHDATIGLDYWIVRNSWGQSWGEQGYIRIVRGQNMCGLAQVPSYPIV